MADSQLRPRDRLRSCLVTRPNTTKSVSFVITLMAVLLLPHAPRAQEHAPTAHHGFGDVAHWAGVFESPDRAKWQKPDEVVRALDLKPGQTVIDIGAEDRLFYPPVRQGRWPLRRCYRARCRTGDGRLHEGGR